MKTINKCNECNVTLNHSNEYCDLCAPHMLTKTEVFMKDLTLQEVSVLEAMVAEEQRIMEMAYGCQWSHVEEYFSAHVDYVKFDPETGIEIGADQVLTPMLKDILVPSEEMEFNSELEAGYISDSSLCLYNEAKESEKYEPDFNDVLKSIETEEVYVSKVSYISKEQSQTNFSYYMRKLEAVTQVKALYVLKDEVLNIQQMSENNRFYFFPKGHSKLFWDAYRAKKESMFKVINAKRESLLVEICGLIKEYSEPAMLIKVNQEIYDAYLPIEVKKALWAKVRIKMQTGEVQIDTVRAIQYMNEVLSA